MRATLGAMSRASKSILFVSAMLVFFALPSQAKTKPNVNKSLPAKVKTAKTVTATGRIPAADEKQLRDLDSKYQKSKAVAMKVDKTLKIGLLGEERKSNGTLWISGSQMRMELDGTEKSLLVVNKKNLWAVTYPGSDFPDAPVQVITGDANTKKGRSKNVMSLLSVGGFLKFFDPEAVKTDSAGEKVYTLVPKDRSTDFKRAEVRLAKDGKSIAGLKYWDQRDNETEYDFRDVSFDVKDAFGKKIDAKLFDYIPPKNAETMTL